MSNETKCTACDGSGLHPNEVPGVGTEWVGCPDCPDKCEWCGQSDDKHENGCRFGLGPDEPDAFDSLPIAALLHARLASWFGDDRQSFLVADLVPVVTQIVAEFQHNAVEMARKADQAEFRAEEAEFHVEQLRDARERAERSAERMEARAVELATERDAALARIARAERLIDSWERDAPDHSNPVFIGRLRECLRRDPAPVRLRREEHHHEMCGTATVGDRQVPGCWVETDPDECEHHWLDRPESDTRECLICGTEASG